MPKTVVTYVVAALVLLSSFGFAHASSCNSPARTLTVLAAAKVDVGTTTPSEASQKLMDDLAILAEAQARELRDVPLDQMTPKDRDAFFAALANERDDRLRVVHQLAESLLEDGSVRAAQRLQHYVDASQACTTAHRTALLTAMADDGRLPSQGGLLPQLAKADLLFACGVALQPRMLEGEHIGADGSPTFWQACAQVALAAAGRDNPDHFRVMHAIAEPLCAIDTPEPLVRMMAAQ